MQLSITPDNPLEWLALKINMVPWPLLHAQIMPVISKAVLEAADKGVFEAVDHGHQTVEAIASVCGLQPKPTRELMGLLTALGYFTFRQETFTITDSARRWVLRESPESVVGMMLYNNRVVWPWLEQLGNYLQTGEGIDYHSKLNTEEWGYYQHAMSSATGTEAKEFGRRAPVPKNATRMLDIGGAHGQHAVALCKRLPALTATILDLPEAIAQAAPYLAKSDMGDRVQHQAGNALTDDFGLEQYDIVLMSSLAHHFTPEQNQAVAQRVSAALKPGGVYIINEFIRPGTGAKPELVGSSTDLFYGLTSAAGNYSLAEIKTWHRAAGLKHHREVWYRTLPGRAMIVGRKP
ncbi:class I SAM-dependent methyltransferase [Arsenicibacter rosenii]|uniref:SAM-dependent methyltransferase n=1 Tax=Arsenicibacter rosenii TaxID=1750698 RepID=A0A1S2VD84_9BACT|nr:class I SAM-dependent methyltransferase [Arsenicibacter rosenii]OIN56711.1 SAM-dependent methyltransferase [Arsenicibacter rosenii]